MNSKTKVELESSLMQQKKSVLSSDKRNGKNEEFNVKYRGNKYDISKFLTNHPGGRNILKAFQGLTLDKVLEDVPHSKAAYHLLNECELNNKQAYDSVEVKK